MKKFKIKKKRKVYIELILTLIIIFCFCSLKYYDKKISPKIIDIASSKLEEITTLYIKKNIAPINADLSKLVDVTENSRGEILMTDINYNYAYDIMLDIVKRIQNSILELESGNIDTFQNHNELQTHSNNLYLLVPLGMNTKGTLFSSLGPKIPIKISFYEHVLGTIETKVSEYGINNAIVKVNLIIDLEQKLILPYNEQKLCKQYTLELGAKIINGTVPSIYGGSILQKSEKITP